MPAPCFILMLCGFLHLLRMTRCQDAGSFRVDDLNADGVRYIRHAGSPVSFTVSQSCEVVRVAVEKEDDTRVLTLCRFTDHRASSNWSRCLYNKTTQMFTVSNVLGERMWRTVYLRAGGCAENNSTIRASFNVTLMEPPQIISFRVHINGAAVVEPAAAKDAVAVLENSTLTFQCDWDPGRPPRNATLTRFGILLPTTPTSTPLTMPPRDDDGGDDGDGAVVATKLSRVEHIVQKFGVEDGGVYTCQVEGAEEEEEEGEEKEGKQKKQKSVWMIRAASPDVAVPTANPPQSTPSILVIGLSAGVPGSLLIIVLVVLVVWMWRLHWVMPCADTAGDQDIKSTRRRQQRDDPHCGGHELRDVVSASPQDITGPSAFATTTSAVPYPSRYSATTSSSTAAPPFCARRPRSGPPALSGTGDGDHYSTVYELAIPINTFSATTTTTTTTIYANRDPTYLTPILTPTTTTTTRTALPPLTTPPPPYQLRSLPPPPPPQPTAAPAPLPPHHFVPRYQNLEPLPRPEHTKTLGYHIDKD
ncbi:uncharacterized protein LOC143286533 [Babylonia areolata]|uniref:uncharacterized protein LOC143286533 n=1 Tax=Babylonia areolata TaxID=304850 RepID=UPI003FD44744